MVADIHTHEGSDALHMGSRATHLSADDSRTTGRSPPSTDARGLLSASASRSLTW